MHKDCDLEEVYLTLIVVGDQDLCWQVVKVNHLFSRTDILKHRVQLVIPRVGIDHFASILREVRTHCDGLAGRNY